MRHEELNALAKSNRWSELEAAWLAAVEDRDGDRFSDDFLLPIETTVKAGKTDLAETLGWAWLDSVKARHSATEALHLARQLLLRLPSGEQLRNEVLSLYRQTHAGVADLELWIERSGLTAGKSVKRALRFLDVGTQLQPGRLLLHRTEDDEAGELLSGSLTADEFEVRTARRKQVLTAEQLIDTYNPCAENDFRALSILYPQRLADLAQNDIAALLIGVARAKGGKVDRDELKYMLCPRHVPGDQWSNWWTRARESIKKSRHLRIEGRSPMMIIHEPAGQTLEQETWTTFERAETPRAWLEVIEAYLRENKSQRRTRDEAFLERVQKALVTRAQKFAKHEPEQAFATALVIERLADEGLPPHPEAHGLSVKMLQTVGRPAMLVLALPDAALWSLALPEVKEALPQRWPEVFAELMRSAPVAQLDTLAADVEQAGRGELIPSLVERALAEPFAHVDLVMWVWKGPAIRTALPVPPRTELLSRILTLVGPAREAGNKVAKGADTNTLRAKVRTGLSARDYAGLREVLKTVDVALATAIRRQVDRAEGLGPVVQDEMMTVLREHFPELWVKAKVLPWDEANVLYVTREGLRVREGELNELVNVKMVENARAIGAAAELGDLSENSEYKFALEERDLLRARVAQIQRELAMARVLEVEDLPDDHVSIGHRVHLKSGNGGADMTMTILGPWESDLARQIYAYQTPLARRVLGRKVGDEVTISIDGQERTYRVGAIEPAIAGVSFRA
ncbi:MAG: GreA/GreB family elongation factor [Phycisphaerae bacterium]